MSGHFYTRLHYLDVLVTSYALWNVFESLASSLVTYSFWSSSVVFKSHLDQSLLALVLPTSLFIMEADW